jgi:hypothetical protein
MTGFLFLACDNQCYATPVKTTHCSVVTTTFSLWRGRWHRQEYDPWVCDNVQLHFMRIINNRIPLIIVKVTINQNSSRDVLLSFMCFSMEAGIHVIRFTGPLKKTEYLQKSVCIGWRKKTKFMKKFWEERWSVFLSLHSEYLIQHGPHRKHRVQQFFYCCLCIRCSGTLLTEPLSSNGHFFWLQYSCLLGGTYRHTDSKVIS